MPVYKDKERNTWYFKFSRTVDGRVIQKIKRGFNSKTEATYAELKEIEELKNPRAKIEKLTLGDLFSLFKEYQANKVKSSTINIYNRIYKCHIEPYFSSYFAFSITSDKLFVWKKEIVLKGFNQKYTNMVIGLMRSLIDLALKKEIINDKNLLNELESVKIQKIENNERSVWTFDEINQFLNTFVKEESKEYSYWLYFYAFSNSGMRPNEFRALQVKDIQKDYLVVNKTINSKDNKKDIFLPPKNVNSNRKVLMPHEIIELLKDYTKGYKPDNFIFGKDKAFRETNLKRELVKHYEAAGLHPIVMYGFRHSHATNLIKSGVPIKVVSKRLGHSNASTTMNVYWHLFNDDEMQVLDILNKK
jgi:integrase